MKATVLAILVLILSSIVFFTVRARLNRRTHEILDAVEKSVRGSVDPLFQQDMAGVRLLKTLDEHKLVHGEIEPVRKELVAKYRNTAFLMRAIAVPQIKTPLLTCSMELEFHLNDKQALSDYVMLTPCTETSLGMLFLR